MVPNGEFGEAHLTKMGNSKKGTRSGHGRFLMCTQKKEALNPITNGGYIQYGISIILIEY